MVTPEYIPDTGDVVWVDFSPQVGREQAGTGPALVLSPRTYNQVAELAVVCPLTNRAKGYPFEVRLPFGHRLKGVILADQMKSVDWRGRGGFRKVGKLPRFVVDHVLNRIAVSLQIS